MPILKPELHVQKPPDEYYPSCTYLPLLIMAKTLADKLQCRNLHHKCINLSDLRHMDTAKPWKMF